MAICASRHAGCAVLAVLAVAALAGPAQGALPANFVDELVVGGLPFPTALAFAPDGRMVIATQQGTLLVYRDGALVPVLTFPPDLICTNSERGISGVAVDPDFANTHFIYLFYTLRKGAPVCEGSQVPKNRVSRFVLTPENTVSLASETVLVDNLPSPNGNRNGGDLQFGKDGYLYIGVGDGGLANTAREEHNTAGKVLRITRGGGIPPSNPFQGVGTVRCNLTGGTTPGNRCQETFNRGLRNPWRLVFDPNAAGTVYRINDVGQILREEINQGIPGADYGWNCREGTVVGSTTGACASPPPGLVDPIFEYARNSQVPGTGASSCHAITGGAFVPDGLWPGYDGSYLFGDYICRWMFKLSAGAPHTAADFATSIGQVITMGFGPFEGITRPLYYSTLDEVRRIRYQVPTNARPVARGKGLPVGGPVPLTVTFDAGDSSDPDPVRDLTLTYFWSFGDGTPDVITTSATVDHTYTTAGTFTVTLRARDEDYAFSAPFTFTVQPGNSPPLPTILTPAADDTFRVGQVVSLTGRATDPEDGVLPASRLTWSVILHHGEHTHVYLPPTAGSPVTLTCPAPEDVNAGATSFLEIRLTATDFNNLSNRATRDFRPTLVPVGFGTSPQGLVVQVNGVNFPTPVAITSWPGYVLNVDAPDQSLGATRYTWRSWTDGQPRAHAITTGSAPTLVGATFDAQPQPVLRFYPLTPCRLIDTRGPAGPQGGPSLSSGAVRTFELSGLCGVPASAQALAVNITVAAPSSFGDLRLWAQGSLQPNTSVISYRQGRARANNGLVALGNDGGLSVMASLAGGGTVHLILDVVGYFQ
jgi:glucose/arabinose dehydrogenase/PKD repeat protein